MNRNPAGHLKTHPTIIPKNTKISPKLAQKRGPKNDLKMTQNDQKLTTFYDLQSQTLQK